MARKVRKTPKKGGESRFSLSLLLQPHREGLDFHFGTMLIRVGFQIVATDFQPAQLIKKFFCFWTTEALYIYGRNTQTCLLFMAKIVVAIQMFSTSRDGLQNRHRGCDGHGRLSIGEKFYCKGLGLIKIGDTEAISFFFYMSLRWNELTLKNRRTCTYVQKKIHKLP